MFYEYYDMFIIQKKTVARFVAFRGNLSAGCQKRLNSSTSHFTSTVPLFIAS
jgi:hypothetical protein